MLDQLVKFFVVLFVVVDPPSMAPLFATMTDDASGGYRRRMAIKSSLVALFIFVAFALGGSRFIAVIGISIDAFRIGGGLIRCSCRHDDPRCPCLARVRYPA